MEWVNAQVMRTFTNQTNHKCEVTWRKPSVGRYKCNMGVSFSLMLNKVELGMYIQDDEDRFVLAKTGGYLH